MLKVQICKKVISLTSSNLSFYDLGCFNLKFDILQFKIGCKVLKHGTCLIDQVPNEH